MAWGVPGLQEDGFLPMARAQALRDGARITRSHRGRRWLLIVEGGRAFGLEDRCPHLEAALAKGDCDGRRLWCPKHGFCFDLETGARLSPTPSQAPGDGLRMRTVSYRDDWAGLRLRLSEDQ
ncbi:MAG: Rieske (2Fe-2S) protein [Pseudomonadales bacterium]|jgi:3-phenylpropionate/trans-cinnamate dioxygenase ferredoxin subunit|nr:Rieske (2Fe-2S) protein [Gammaproteobacteria bacterium]